MARLPILMYHDVSPKTSEGLTISASKLEEQFAYLSQSGFQTYFFSELLSNSELPRGRNVIITFDDAYVSQLELAVPLLRKYGLKATFFVPLNYLGKTDEWHSASVPVMTAEQLGTLDRSYVELGYHSFYHRKYNEMDVREIEDDTGRCLATVNQLGLKFTRVVAYPYGKFPRESDAMKRFVEHLSDAGFSLGLRIGNRVNAYPFKQPFEVQRLDIKGEYSLSKFKRKLRFGKLF